jgi:hypothetical protein
MAHARASTGTGGFGLGLDTDLVGCYLLLSVWWYYNLLLIVSRAMDYCSFSSSGLRHLLVEKLWLQKENQPAWFVEADISHSNRILFFLFFHY